MSDASTTRHTEARTPTVPPGRPLASRPIPTGRPRPWDAPAEPEAVGDEQVTAPIPVVGGAQDAPGPEAAEERDGGDPERPAEERAADAEAPGAAEPAEASESAGASEGTGEDPAALRPEPGAGPAGAAAGKDWALPSALTGPQRPLSHRSPATGPQPGLGADLLGAPGAGTGAHGGRVAPPSEEQPPEERDGAQAETRTTGPEADRPTGPQRVLGAEPSGPAGVDAVPASEEQGPEEGRPVPPVADQAAEAAEDVEPAPAGPAAERPTGPQPVLGADLLGSAGAGAAPGGKKQGSEDGGPMPLAADQAAEVAEPAPAGDQDAEPAGAEASTGPQHALGADLLGGAGDGSVQDRAAEADLTDPAGGGEAGRPATGARPGPHAGAPADPAADRDGDRTGEDPAPDSGEERPEPVERRNRNRLHRAGIHNIWHYDDQVFDFADGRLLLRGRNGAGKSKALEMLLPFLLDGDARRLDTTGTGRTGFRWLMADGRVAAPARPDGAAEERDGADPAPGEEPDEAVRIGYLWVEFAQDGEDAPAVTLGAAVTAAPGRDVRCTHFVTDRRVGTDLELVRDGRPMPVERLRAEVGAENCYDTAGPYRTRVMRDLFGLDDPVRYRNLVHLLYRLRRPTIGERLEAGELVSVLAEALPPMDESVLDQVARNVADLEEARGRLEALRGARGHVEEFLADYRGYLHRVLGERAAEVRTRLDEHGRRAAEAERLEEELDRLVTEESAVQEERDRARRTRDTAGSDAATLTAAGEAAPTATDHELQARYAAVTAYIRAAEAAWTAAGYALTAEERAKETLAGGLAAVDEAIAALRALHAEAAEAARAAGIDPGPLGTVPQPVRTVLAPRESVTHVDFEGLERAVERDPVPGVDLDALRGGLADLHDRLTRADEAAAERAGAAERLRAAAAECAGAEEREAALRGEAESADAALERARARERAAVEAVRTAGASYAARVRTWLSDLREAAPDADLDAAAAAVEELVEPPHDDALGLLGPDVPDRVAEAAHAAVDPLLRELRSRRDTALGEERELITELDELSERKAGGAADPAPPAPPWAAAVRDRGAGAPLYALVDFADGLSAAEQAGLEGALEASGLLNAWIAADGSALSADTSDIVLSPGRPAPGPSLLDVLAPLADGAGEDRAGIGRDRVEALLAGIALLPADGDPGAEPRHRRRRDGEQAGPACAVALDGRWRLGALSGAHRKTAVEHIGTAARDAARDRSLANVKRRIDIAEALLAEAGERRGDAERAQDELVGISRGLPGPGGLAAAWAALEDARGWLAGTEAEQRTAARAAEEARGAALALRRSLRADAERAALPAEAAELDATAAALDGLRVRLAAALRDLQALAVLLDRAHDGTEQWRQARGDRVVAEDARTAAIGDMITVRRDIELTDRARAADPDRIGAAVAEVRERMEAAADRVPDLERSAQRARDERVAAETRLGSAAAERAEQARRALEAGAALRAALTGADAAPDPDLLAAAGLEDAAEPLDRLVAADAAEEGERLAALEELTAAVQAGLEAAEAPGEEVDDSGILRRREALHRLLAGGSSVGARTELTEHAGVKRVAVHDDAGAHDVTAYAARLAEAEAEAEEAAALREEEAYERHLLGELAGHLARQIDEARALIATMNEVLGDVTTSQGLGVRIEWGLAPDADEDVRAVVPLLARPAERRTRLETTRLRDALRRCIEAIRRLDPTATGGAQLRAALDYRSWFAFTVHITDAARPDRERRLSHRTGLSQGEQRVVAYLVLFAAAAAQFDAVQANAPAAPRLILLDDAFAKVDEPTHGRLLGLLVQLDLDFVLTSERVWGCFASVPGLHIYECLRDPAVPGIATLHFSWDGSRRRLLGV